METQPSEIYGVDLAPLRDGEPAMELPPDSSLGPRVDAGDGVDMGFSQPESPQSSSEDNPRAEEVLEMGDAPVVKAEPVSKDAPCLEVVSGMDSDQVVSAGRDGEGSQQPNQALELVFDQAESTSPEDTTLTCDILLVEIEQIISADSGSEDDLTTEEAIEMAGYPVVSSALGLDEDQIQQEALDMVAQQVLSSGLGFTYKLQMEVWEIDDSHVVSSTQSPEDYQTPEEVFEMEVGQAMRPRQAVEIDGDHLGLGQVPDDNQGQEQDLKIDDDQVVRASQDPEGHLRQENVPDMSDGLGPEDDQSPGEALKMDSNENMSPDSQTGNKPWPWKPYPGKAKPEESNTLSLPFPVRLWMAVEDEALPSVYWSDEGDTIIIEEHEFQINVLQQEGEGKLFETDSLKIFKRLMSLYGFRRARSKIPSVHSSQNRKIMFYRNSKFKRDQPMLVETIQKKINVASSSEMAEPTPKRRKKAKGSRRSPRLHQKDYMEENALQGVPKAPQR
ncbi:uncharacterized protein LOC132535914 [Erinaceus europaeus]|uniref:Uncharacterized protein LOC132535914 n=1 Tax=Erinaceus europaeus TaxID=9365 RepID=A0ABM3WS93_ERIEU|nr:uncharacterized protein LOC132535914 [Erinaceus europaeus]